MQWHADPCSDLLLAEDQDGPYTKRGRRQGSRDRASLAVVGVGEAEMPIGLWELFLIKVDGPPNYKLVD